uniref:COesterase domain-containing protein n=1 Tax=Heterorhabditis bacteriophora TaxID=37862 RepID=A0A1I7X7R5_HETBA
MILYLFFLSAFKIIYMSMPYFSFILKKPSDPYWFNRTLRDIDPKGIALSTYIGPYHTKDEEFTKYQSFCFYNPGSDICAIMEMTKIL